MNIQELFSVKDKVVVITGSTRGIGAAIAKGYKEAGASVWIHGRKEESTKRAAEKMGFDKYVAADLSNIQDVEKMVEHIISVESKVDVLINNAGYEDHASIENMDFDLMDKIYDINTKAHYLLFSKLIPLLKKSDSASVINVTSIHDIVAVRNNSPYCMSKAAMGMMSKVAALELGNSGIRVNNLAPGAIATDMNRDLLKKLEEDNGTSFGEWIPLNRVGEVEEMVGPAIFLGSKASSYITGTTIYADGGYKENLLRY
ncbi:SDR family oxidoreductase [Vallitalea sediminicola]